MPDVEYVACSSHQHQHDATCAAHIYVRQLRLLNCYLFLLPKSRNSNGGQPRALADDAGWGEGAGSADDGWRRADSLRVTSACVSVERHSQIRSFSYINHTLIQASPPPTRRYTFWFRLPHRHAL